MTYSEAEILKNRILACRQNELTKRLSIKTIFAIINSMREPDAPTLTISKTICPRCGTKIEKWGIKL